MKARTKWRDTKRTPRKATSEAESVPEPETETASQRHIYRVNHHEKRKPMTLDEAVLEMDKDRDYLVYRDAETDRVTVLVRRRDGHFDLVEA